MIGTLRPEVREVTIVGGGIAGLLAAYELDRAGYSVTLLEREARAGGLIRTERTELGLVESAAHSLLATPEVRGLCDELGVELAPVREGSRARFVLRRGRLRRFPLGPIEALRAFFRAYLVLAHSGRPSESLTLEEWALRFLGRPALDYLVAPFVTGIYGARPSELQIGAALPALAVPRGHSLLSYQLHRWRMRSGSRPSRPEMAAPAEGMGALVAALERRLEERLGGRFRRGEAVPALPRGENVILCIPAPQAAELLREESPELSAALREVRYSGLICATAFVSRRDLPRAPRGVGVLMSEREKRDCLGILFNSSAFPGRVADESEWVSVTAMLGGTHRPGMIRCDDAEIEKAVRAELESALGLRGGAKVRLFIRRWEKAVPLYDARLVSVWEKARETWCSRPGRVLFGNYTGKVSLRGMIETAAGLRSLGSGIATLR